MKRALIPPMLLALCAGAALAQPRPYFYLSAIPPNSSTPDLAQASVCDAVEAHTVTARTRPVEIGRSSRTNPRFSSYRSCSTGWTW